MSEKLNLPTVSEALIKAGLNQAGLAEKLKVSREAVSKWLKGDSFPQPDKLLRIGMLLGLTFEQLVQSQPILAIPVVSFRKKANRITTETDMEHARATGELLKKLVPHLPKQELTRPPTLKDPTPEYRYVQKVANQVRCEMKIEDKKVIDFTDLIKKFNELDAIIAPVLWGEQQHHGNALNIHLPDSQTTWVFLNLDSNVIDFKFWMAHELGHSFAPRLGGQVGEDFADHFAQALLYPGEQAADLYLMLKKISLPNARVQRIIKEAKNHVISPYTIRKALEGYEVASGLPKIELGDYSKFMAATTQIAKGSKKITNLIFGENSPNPKDYISVARRVFDSPFFEALKEFGGKEEGLDHYIRRILGVSLADAKALSGELRA